MKHILFALIIGCAMISSPATSRAQTNAAPPVNADDREKATIEKHFQPIHDSLKLKDADKEAKVHEAFATFFKAQQTWHAENDAKITPLWAEFSKAHTKKDDAATEAANDKITAAYATFKPTHDKFLADLSAVLSPNQVTAVKDALTLGTVERTMGAYGQIFHGITDEQKAYARKELEAAREESIDTPNKKEIALFFKKHKNHVEAYLTAQGYDVKKSYQEFVAKQKGNAADQ